MKIRYKLQNKNYVSDQSIWLCDGNVWIGMLDVIFGPEPSDESIPFVTVVGLLVYTVHGRCIQYRL